MADDDAELHSHSRLKILLGTEDDWLRHMLGRQLADTGLADVAPAASIADVRRIATVDAPDVVVLDVALARSRDWGIERLRAVSDAPVIVLVHDDPVRSVPLPPGATAYVTVPPLDALVDTLLDIVAIARLLGASRDLDARRG